ncbi:hypothetical protein [Leptotrichia hofstadii]|uniref:SHOCT domain-containing protein n=1 Tax=Leptotrichia hofstadii F0254 TaxID=634994 RepID=C9MWP6_9FUSO|nr:hypothetical protein [Leptotrichia hofstadii]EEX74912.1 hypothetical protein GCWU000323_00967 [Leptotrichia hofstadii F0254]
MKKIGKKRILGIALLTSLSIFAGTTIAANNSSRTATANSATNDECKPPHRLQKDSNGNLVDENGNIIKKTDPARIEELRTKLNNGKITKNEGEEIAKMLERKGSHGKPNNKCKPKNIPKRLTDTEIQSLTNSLNSGKVSKDEASKLIEMLNSRHRGPRPDDMPQN